MIDVVDKKRIFDSAITGKDNASKDWNCITSVFLTSFNVYFVFGYAYFMCICLKIAIWLFLTFLGQDLAFLVKTGWQACWLARVCQALGGLGLTQTNGYSLHRQWKQAQKTWRWERRSKQRHIQCGIFCWTRFQVGPRCSFDKAINDCVIAVVALRFALQNFILKSLLYFLFSRQVNGKPRHSCGFVADDVEATLNQAWTTFYNEYLTRLCHTSDVGSKSIAFI